MAVPKKKTSHSKSRMRKSHDFLVAVGTVENKLNGSVHRQHHIDSEGFYKGRLVFSQNKKTIAAEEE